MGRRDLTILIDVLFVDKSFLLLCL